MFEDPIVLVLILIGTLVLKFICMIFGDEMLSAVLTIINLICLIILVIWFFMALEERMKPLREAEAVYADYVTEILESYGYTDISVKLDLSAAPSDFDPAWSPDIQAAGSGDPDFTKICRMIKKMNNYEDKDGKYKFEADRITLSFNGETGRYSYLESDGVYYKNLRTLFVYNKKKKKWIPEKPIRGMGESQINKTLLGKPTAVTETEEGTSYFWDTGERDNYEAIVRDGHVAIVRVMDTYRGSEVFAEDVQES